LEYLKDAFISYSSKNSAIASKIKEELENNKFSIWLDTSELEYGVLLRDQIQSSIFNSRVLILLWSRYAYKSRWVRAELLSAFHSRHFLIPCVLDNTKLPQFLQDTKYIDLRNNKDNVENLSIAIRNAPNSSNIILPFIGGINPELAKILPQIIQKQNIELRYLFEWNIKEAKKYHMIVEKLVLAAEKKWIMYLDTLNVAGYHRKNAYMLKYWDQIQAGSAPPQDSLLREAEQFFFKALFVNPYDFTAINGLGSILILERELDAAEFFIKRSIELSKGKGVTYAEALHDLRLVEDLKNKN
jgi:hypothetical protein